MSRVIFFAWNVWDKQKPATAFHKCQYWILTETDILQSSKFTQHSAFFKSYKFTQDSVLTIKFTDFSIASFWFYLCSEKHKRTSSVKTHMLSLIPCPNSTKSNFGQNFGHPNLMISKMCLLGATGMKIFKESMYSMEATLVYAHSNRVYLLKQLFTTDIFW